MATLNVFTLGGGERFRKRMRLQALRQLSKVNLLLRQFREHDIQIVAIQETRSKEDTCLTVEGYHVVYSAATSDGQYGCAIGVNVQEPSEGADTAFRCRMDQP